MNRREIQNLCKCFSDSEKVLYDSKTGETMTLSLKIGDRVQVMFYPWVDEAYAGMKGTVLEIYGYSSRPWESRSGLVVYKPPFATISLDKSIDGSYNGLGIVVSLQALKRITERPAYNMSPAEFKMLECGDIVVYRKKVGTVVKTRYYEPDDYPFGYRMAEYYWEVYLNMEDETKCSLIMTEPADNKGFPYYDCLKFIDGYSKNKLLSVLELPDEPMYVLDEEYRQAVYNSEEI